MLNRNTPVKKRSSSCYQNKIRKITKWYNDLIIYREKNILTINPNTKTEVKRKELEPLEFYIEKIKKPFGENR